MPDMGVRVAFLDRPLAASTPERPPRTGVLVPAEAVRPDGEQGVVFVYADGKVERRRVVPGQALGAERQILSGLRRATAWCVSPPDSLRDGAAVKLTEGG